MANSLAQFVTETFKRWSENRAPLEAKWQKNHDGYTAVSTGVWKQGETEGWRSSTFLNLIKMKVISAWALIIDMVLQGGKLPFLFKPGPEEEQAMASMQDEERKSVEGGMHAMEKLIDQQMQDCNADRQTMRLVLLDAKYGEVFAKKYVHEVTRRGFVPVRFGNETRFEYVKTARQSPAWETVTPWDIFRDLETDDPRTGAGFIHRQFLSPFELRQNTRKPLFIANAVEKVLSERTRQQQAEGDSSKTISPGMRELQKRSRSIQVLEFWGRAPRRLVEEFMQELESGAETALPPGTALEDNDDGDDVECMVQVAGDEVIRFALTEQEDRPLYRIVWEIDPDGIGAIGIPDNLEQIQLAMNGAVRAFEDNKKLSSNLIMGRNPRLIEGGSSDWYPGKDIECSESCDDINKALKALNIPDVGKTLIDMMGIYERYADMMSQVPQITQGIRPDSTANTAYELSQLMENAGKYLGAVIKNLDEGLIEPIVMDFYVYNMEDPEVQEGKGNWIVQALGFTSFQNRFVRLQKFMQLLNLALSDRSGVIVGELKSRGILEEIGKAMDIEEYQLLKSDEEKQQERQAAMAEQERAMQQQLQMADAMRGKQLEDAAAMKELEHEHAMERKNQELEGQMAMEGLRQGHDLGMRLA